VGMQLSDQKLRWRIIEWFPGILFVELDFFFLHDNLNNINDKVSPQNFII
jgi:hypothetical protein